MAYYKRCPNCGCDDHDWSIARCEHNHLFCTGCSTEAGGFLGIGSHTACPRCGSSVSEYVGEIEPSSDDSDSICSDDNGGYEGLAELIEDAVAAALDKRERNAELRREEQLRAIEKARIADEARIRSEHYALLDSLYALSPNGLESKLSPFNSNKDERELAIKVKVVKQSEEDNLAALCRSMGNREPKDDWEYLNKKRLFELREIKDREAKHRFEKISNKPEEAKLRYITEHPNDPICEDLALSLTMAENLKIALDNYRGIGFNDLQKRYSAMVEIERIEQLPWLFKKLAYLVNPEQRLFSLTLRSNGTAQKRATP